MNFLLNKNILTGNLKWLLIIPIILLIIIGIIYLILKLKENKNLKISKYVLFIISIITMIILSILSIVFGFLLTIMPIPQILLILNIFISNILYKNIQTQKIINELKNNKSNSKEN